MKKLFELYPNKTRRAIEISIPLTSLLIITMPFWLSFWHPAIVAYILITFNVFWFYKAAKTAYYAIRSYLTLLAHTKIDWLHRAQTLPNFHLLYHAIIIPEYKEPLHILERTLDTLLKQNFPKEKIIIVFAQESKDDQADKTAEIIKNKYKNQFGYFFLTKHTLKPGEVAGKSSNMASAGKYLVTQLQELGIPLSFVTVTSCDADAMLHPNYLANVSYHFLTSPDNQFQLYQAAILFYTNIWRVPLPSRVKNTLGSFYNLATLSMEHKLITFSTYTAPLQTIAEAGYWGVDVIPEDYHVYFKMYFLRGAKLKTQPIFLPILVDAAESNSFWKTMINSYEQEKRWAWGVSDLPFVIRGCFVHTEIPLFDRLRRLYTVMEHHLLWPTNWFLLTVGSTIPSLINPAFGRTALGHNLSQLSSSILTLSFIFLLVVMIIDIRLKPPRPKEFETWKLPFLLVQWITIPIVSFFLGALPGLDAHTRLMLGKRLEYRLTEKV